MRVNTSVTGGRGDEADEFAVYAAANTTRLVRLGFLLVRDHHRAEDLVQEALARLHRRWRYVRNHDSPDAYVRKIMVNQMLSWRRRDKIVELSLAGVAEPAADDRADTVDERDALWRLIGTLPPQQRSVIVLRFYEDLPDDSIANILNCSTATVRSHASKALAHLRVQARAPQKTPGGTDD